jgi:hypothetical protein
MRKARRALLALGSILLLAGVLWPTAAPRLTLYDVGLRLDYPLRTLAGPLLAALGFTALAAASPRGGLRLALALLVPLALAPGVERLAWRVEADAAGIRQGELFGSEQLAWSQVTAVHSGRELRLARQDGSELRLPLAPLTPQQRAALERTIARRVAGPGAQR